MKIRKIKRIERKLGKWVFKLRQSRRLLKKRKEKQNMDERRAPVQRSFC